MSFPFTTKQMCTDYPTGRLFYIAIVSYVLKFMNTENNTNTIWVWKTWWNWTCVHRGNSSHFKFNQLVQKNNGMSWHFTLAELIVPWNHLLWNHRLVKFLPLVQRYKSRTTNNELTASTNCSTGGFLLNPYSFLHCHTRYLSDICMTLSHEWLKHLK